MAAIIIVNFVQLPIHLKIMNNRASSHNLRSPGYVQGHIGELQVHLINAEHSTAQPSSAQYKNSNTTLYVNEKTTKYKINLHSLYVPHGSIMFE